MGGKGRGERGVVLPLAIRSLPHANFTERNVERRIIYGCGLDHATLSSAAVYSFCECPLALVVAGSGYRWLG
jgi:hypothetical protein